jgi:hypothetical protein
MLLRLLLLLTALLAYSWQSQAQVFESGFLVRSNGDTLRGEIENGFWLEPPAFVRYRATPASPSQLFQPRQLRAVSFTGGRYFRFGVYPIDHAAETKLTNLPQGLIYRVSMDSLLAEVLVEGPATLLRIALPSAVHFLLSVPDQPMLELSERKYLGMSENGSLAIVDGNNYRNQLQLYLGTCPAAAAAAQTAPFTAAGMVVVAQAYNQTCSPARQPGRSWLAQSKPTRLVSFQGGVQGGVRYNSIESPLFSADFTCVDCWPRPFAGLYAELFMPSRTLALYGELSASRYQSQYLEYTGLTAAGVPIFRPQRYRAWLGTARLGVRVFFPLPHERQWLLGFGYELNAVSGGPYTISAGQAFMVALAEYAAPTLLPNLTLGWRANRATLSTDVQLYRDSRGSDYFGQFFGTNFAARLSLAYRLGSNPDEAGRRPAAQP